MKTKVYSRKKHEEIYKIAARYYEKREIKERKRVIKEEDTRDNAGSPVG